MEAVPFMISELFVGEFQPFCMFDDESVPIGQIKTALKGEKVTSVKRCCCSLTGWFPSGIITVVTWMLVGQAVRHEFVICNTSNFVILIEVARSPKSSKTKYITQIAAKTAKSKEEKKKTEKLLLKGKWYVRKMKVLEGLDLGNLVFDQILALVSIWIISNRAGDETYSIFQKNCKGLARSILYFSKKSVNYWDIMYSIWGIFTDKPGNIFYHVSAISIDKGVVNANYHLSKTTKEMIEKTIKCIKLIHSYQANDNCEVQDPSVSPA